MIWASIGSDNGLSPVRRQANISTNTDLLSIRPLGTNFSEILIKIQNYSFTKLHLKLSSAKWQPFCPGVNALRRVSDGYPILLQTQVMFEHANVWVSDLFSLTQQNSRRCADDIFKCFFMNEKSCILIRNSQKFVREAPIDKKSTLVLAMAWRRTENNPLTEPMLPSSLKHIWGKWVNSYK